eukprot:TRINITY_DN3747_c0_g3_i1.p1 TRINITY_DN3747_c0_g3~~TRINITY_DN3747_c0_g3_i1.p1  ORF type:complete len:437 (+),score=48.26 TRINITY_DN3747_c0_g3_i1:103-1413(+)
MMSSHKIWRSCNRFYVFRYGGNSTVFSHENPSYTYSCRRFLHAVWLKWVKNRGFDHVIKKETDIKSVCVIKDIIKDYPGQELPVTVVLKKQKHLELTISALRFMRRFPTIFEEFEGPKYNVPWFRLTKEAIDVDKEEERVIERNEMDFIESLCRLLMMMKSREIPLKALEPWKWDLGLPPRYSENLIRKYPEYVRVVDIAGIGPVLSLVKWRDEFAVSALQKKGETEKPEDLISCEGFTKRSPLEYEMKYPRRYDLMNKVKAWREEWNRIPYISPYEDASRLDPESDLMEKRIVGVFHELLNLTIHRRFIRENVRAFVDELLLPKNFGKIFSRYPGIFYLSLKKSLVTITLREGYRSAQLVEKHPLVAIREKYFYMMRMGILYRKGGTVRINTRWDRYPLKLDGYFAEKRHREDDRQLYSENSNYCESSEEEQSDQ